jgi:DNA-binding transcriptional ArsR family regulator
MKKFDLIVHPVRSRIVVAVSGRSLSTRQIAQMLPDVPVPTLYRHVRVLDEAGILRRTDERKVRGTAERFYTLAEGGGAIDRSALPSLDDHLLALTNFAAVITQSYRAYVDGGGTETPLANMRPIYLTDEERETLGKSLNDAFRTYGSNGPGEGRKRRLISFIDLPDTEPSEAP